MSSNGVARWLPLLIFSVYLLVAYLHHVTSISTRGVAHVILLERSISPFYSAIGLVGVCGSWDDLYFHFIAEFSKVAHIIFLVTHNCTGDYMS